MSNDHLRRNGLAARPGSTDGVHRPTRNLWTVSGAVNGTTKKIYPDPEATEYSHHTEDKPSKRLLNLKF